MFFLYENHSSLIRSKFWQVDFSVNIPKKADASVDVQRSFESVHSGEASTSVTRNAGEQNITVSSKIILPC